MSKTTDNIARRYARALYEVAEESGDLTALEKDLLRIEAFWQARPELLSPRHMLLLPAIVKAWRELRAQVGAPIFAKIEVPCPLTAAEEQTTAQRISKALGHQVELRISVKPELLGGAVLHIGGRLFDVSVRGRLEDACQQLAEEYTRPEL